jgi:hypothetical protein
VRGTLARTREASGAPSPELMGWKCDQDKTPAADQGRPDETISLDKMKCPGQVTRCNLKMAALIERRSPVRPNTRRSLMFPACVTRVALAGIR